VPSEFHELDILGPLDLGFETVLTKDAMNFVGTLVTIFEQRRRELLERRLRISEKIGRSVFPSFLYETENVRRDSWKIGPQPSDLSLRRSKIYTQVDRLIIISE